MESKREIKKQKECATVHLIQGNEAAPRPRWTWQGSAQLQLSLKVQFNDSGMCCLPGSWPPTFQNRPASSQVGLLQSLEGYGRATGENKGSFGRVCANIQIYVGCSKSMKASLWYTAVGNASTEPLPQILYFRGIRPVTTHTTRGSLYSSKPRSCSVPVRLQPWKSSLCQYKNNPQREWNLTFWDNRSHKGKPFVVSKYKTCFLSKGDF